MKYHQKIGTKKFCFKNEDHNNLDMSRSLDIIQLIEFYLVGLNSVIMAKELYQEYIRNSDLAFQYNILTSNYISNINDKMLPNSLSYELENNGPKNHQEQIKWIIEELEKIRSRAEKTRLKGFDKKETRSDVFRASLNFIDKKENENIYNENIYQNERFNRINRVLLKTTTILIYGKITQIEILDLQDPQTEWWHTMIRFDMPLLWITMWSRRHKKVRKVNN